MSDWLDVMLEEIARKKEEAREAEEEQRRRAASDGKSPLPKTQTAQSK